MSNLPDIDFEGQLVKPKNGRYRCPFRCHNAQYAAPSWKTEQGFRDHMEICSCSPSGVARKTQLEAIRGLNEEQLCEAAAARLGITLGSEVFYTGFKVTEPTHIMRGTRRVRVRYEEVRSYFGASARVESMSWVGSLVLNGCIPAINLCTSLDEAKAKALKAQNLHLKHLELAAAAR